MSDAPGKPGKPPTWSASRKSAVGVARNPVSRLWFTLGEGIVSELYYPRIDTPSVRDFGLFVTDGESFFSDEQHDADHTVRWLADGVPAFELTNRCKRGRYVITKKILTNPRTHALVQLTRFEPTAPGDYKLYARIAPHLRDRGQDNHAFVGDFKGLPLLMARRDGAGLAVACSSPWLKRSAGYVGESDGRVDLLEHKRMTWAYPEAESGNVTLTGEIDLSAGNEFVLVVAFGQNADEAGFRCRQTLLRGFDAVWEDYRSEWEAWHAASPPPPAELAGTCNGCTHWRVGRTVLAVHESRDMPGGLIASLASPWGDTRGDDDTDGYHVVWPRDCAETAGALLAAGDADAGWRVMDFLRCTQEADGHWPQSMWLSGKPAQNGIQMDEAALPILTLDTVRRTPGATDVPPPAAYWRMVERAATFIATRGPTTEQDRWEHNPGYTPFTLGSEIAALLVAADAADEAGRPDLATHWRQTADAWHASIDRWLYATGTDLARRVGVDGYYVRIATHDPSDKPLAEQRVDLANTHPTEYVGATDLVSPDALALVRFGLRAADDPRIVNTVKVIDAVLKTETVRGPVWHRYNGDRYGEHADGSAFKDGGIGRGWPLLVGERAHYELAAGRIDEAKRLLGVMQAFADDSGLVPEQVWDAADLPAAGLFNGRPTFSACPLVWAHAEQLKLIRSIADGRVFDLPPRAFARYVRGQR